MNTRWTTLALTILISLATLIGLLALLEVGSGDGLAVHAQGTVRYVAITGTNSGDCSSLASPCQTMQYAVDQANSGDAILVALGVYTGVTARAGTNQHVYISKTVTLRGGYSLDFASWDPVIYSTTLNAGNGGRVIYVQGNISPTLEGLRITGGRVVTPGEYGGGIYVLSATALISGNAIYGNYAYSGGGGVQAERSPLTLRGNDIYTNRVNAAASALGGGAYIRYSPAAVLSNTFHENASYIGGGLAAYFSAATVRDNAILSNTATNGGGAMIVDTDDALNRTTLQENTIRGNVASGSSSYGGGLFVGNGTHYVLGNIVQGNTVGGFGGGIALYETNSILRGNIVQGNKVAAGGNTAGGGIYSYDYYGRASSTLENNVVVDNVLTSGSAKGAGLLIDSTLDRILHTTIARNTGGDGSGVCILDTALGGPVLFTNTIIVSHVVGISTSVSNAAIVDYVLWYSNTRNVSGTGTVVVNHAVSGNPAFAADGYHITPASAAVNVGVWTSVSSDIDGDARPQGSKPELGADELPEVGLAVGKWADELLYQPGQTITYTLVVTSTGVQTVTSVLLTDTLPVQQQALAMGTDRGTCSFSSGWGAGATCQLGNMPSGATAHLTLTARVTTTAPSQAITMRNRVDVASAETANWTYADTLFQSCYVRLNADPTNYTTVQAAVDASTSPGDVVKVAGICVGVNDRGGLAQQVYISRSLTLQGGWEATFTTHDPDQYPTTLDALGLGRVLVITATPRVTVEGLRLTGGDASGLKGGGTFQAGEGFGGGVYIQAVTTTISNCLFYSNTASRLSYGYGGGLGVYTSVVTLTNNTFRGNVGNTPGGLVIGIGGGVALKDSNGSMLSGNVISGNTASVDGQGQGGGVYLENSNATLSGNIVQGNLGSTSGSTSGGFGGGVYLARSGGAILDANTIQTNTAGTATLGAGGGVYMNDSDGTTLRSNVIRSNIASTADIGQGGGVFINSSDAVLTGNLVLSNAATTVTSNGYGGGVFIFGNTPVLSGNTVQNNVASASGAGYGGGLYLSYSSATLNGDAVMSNTASTSGVGYGGGVYLNYSDATLNNCLIRRNDASAAAAGYGGGVYCCSSNYYDENSTLRNVVVADNRLFSGLGAGLYISRSNPSLLHVTIARNTGGDGSGAYVTNSGTNYSNPVFTNTILVSQTVGVSVVTSNTARLNGVLWFGNSLGDTSGDGVVTVTNSTTADPAFAADGYHISAASGAVDRGVASGMAYDIDGEARPFGCGYDLGADEDQTAIGPLPGVPTLLDPPDGTVTATQSITLSWQPGACGMPPTGYNVQLNGVVVTRTDTISPTLLFTGVHTWTVRAFNALGYSAWATPWTVEVGGSGYRVYLPLIRK